ncbi:hypothetical protein BRCH_01552c [Candidatus Burkholderia brachyanthoides]|nr:hypothetical protein BRCH_01552c [Candidatus Burkholderia brachyanthoides]
MAVDWFLIDAPYVVPAEFAAWRDAKKRHEDLFHRALDTDERTKQYAALGHSALEARAEAERFETAVRTAWMQRITTGKETRRIHDRRTRSPCCQHVVSEWRAACG